jgi:hypothetical protein
MNMKSHTSPAISVNIKSVLLEQGSGTMRENEQISKNNSTKQDAADHGNHTAADPANHILMGES